MASMQAKSMKSFITSKTWKLMMVLCSILQVLLIISLALFPYQVIELVLAKQKLIYFIIVLHWVSAAIDSSSAKNFSDHKPQYTIYEVSFLSVSQACITGYTRVLCLFTKLINLTVI
uniref:Uncharacterized protein n=1 Tax=Glossina brevipalpis TaxID=37001 RepID=A0A1A9WMZ3_9MUSC